MHIVPYRVLNDIVYSYVLVTNVVQGIPKFTLLVIMKIFICHHW